MTKKLMSSLLAIIIAMSCTVAVPVFVSAAEADVVLKPIADTYVNGGKYANTDFKGEERLVTKVPKGNDAANINNTEAYAHGLMEFDLSGIEFASGEAVESAILDFKYLAYDQRDIYVYRIEESIADKSVTWNSEEFSKYWSDDYAPSADVRKVVIPALPYTSGSNRKSGSVDLAPLIDIGDTKLTIMFGMPKSNSWETNFVLSSLESSDQTLVPTLSITKGSAIRELSDGILDADYQVEMSYDGSSVTAKLPGDYTGAGAWAGLSAKESYTLMKLDLSVIPEGKSIENLEFTFRSDGERTSSNEKIYMIPGLSDDWDSETIATVDNYNIIEAACSDEENVAAVAAGVANYNFDRKVNLTAAARRAIIAGNKTLTIAFARNPQSNLLIYSSKAASPYFPKASIKYNLAPAFAIDTEAVNPNGSATLKTDITDDALDFVELRKADDGSVVEDVVKSYDLGRRTITITPQSDLEFYTEYNIVLLAGITDIYGSSLTEDTIASVFTTGGAIDIAPAKFTSDANPVYDTCTELSAYTAGMELTAICEITNTSSTGKNAIMLVVQYGADGSMLYADIDAKDSAIPAGETVTYSKTITAMDSDGGRIEVFIIDNSKDITPLMDTGVALPYSAE